VQAKELLRRMGTKGAPILLDPRSPIEFKRGHVPGALNAPVWKILLGTAPLPQNRSREIVIACMHGQRAYIANWAMVLLGYRNLDYLDGFLEDWLSAGLPWTTRPGKGKANPRRGRQPTPRKPRPAVASARKAAARSSRSPH
jgi:hydroxyacylglutathione hydrolase